MTRSREFCRRPARRSRRNDHRAERLISVAQCGWRHFDRIRLERPGAERVAHIQHLFAAAAGFFSRSLAARRRAGPVVAPSIEHLCHDAARRNRARHEPRGGGLEAFGAFGHHARKRHLGASRGLYKFRGQWANSWKEGRFLLAGHAAHLTPPFAGQGLCSGIRDSAALAWRLDLALRGILPDGALDSYGPERTAHVRKWIDFAVELGKVICIPDPEAAAQRDREMLAAQAQPDFRPPPRPSPRLGPGLWLEDAPGSGILGPQGLVERNGRRGLFDDLVGVRFAVIARSPAILGEISEVNGKALELLGAAIVHFDESAGGLKDVEGTYHRFPDGLGCEAMLARPDFYLLGAARNAAELTGCSTSAGGA
ncbi:FAD-dependent monooxygenase [Rhodoblastus sp.]|uniref:FAD-dependent monooxygenase n=1 Tax=Rhodoblastus sp. TaxID=1962975 RepID=UPI003F9E533A